MAPDQFLCAGSMSLTGHDVPLCAAGRLWRYAPRSSDMGLPDQRRPTASLLRLVGVAKARSDSDANDEPHRHGQRFIEEPHPQRPIPRPDPNRGPGQPHTTIGNCSARYNGTTAIAKARPALKRRPGGPARAARPTATPATTTKADARNHRHNSPVAEKLSATASLKSSKRRSAVETVAIATNERTVRCNNDHERICRLTPASIALSLLSMPGTVGGGPVACRGERLNRQTHLQTAHTLDLARYRVFCVGR